MTLQMLFDLELWDNENKWRQHQRELAEKEAILSILESKVGGESQPTLDQGGCCRETCAGGICTMAPRGGRVWTKLPLATLPLCACHSGARPDLRAARRG